MQRKPLNEEKTTERRETHRTQIKTNAAFRQAAKRRVPNIGQSQQKVHCRINSLYHFTWTGSGVVKLMTPPDLFFHLVRRKLPNASME